MLKIVDLVDRYRSQCRHTVMAKNFRAGLKLAGKPRFASRQERMFQQESI